MNIPETSLILVAIIPNQRDLDIARLLGWYRIPLKSAPKVISVDYLALYQTAAFDETERWKINYVSVIKGYELTTRRELLHDESDHPRAQEEYFKLQLGPLERLQFPIPAGNWRRVTFLYTTGRHLTKAKNISDLVVHDDERDILWHSLRERALAENEYHADQLPEFPTDPIIMSLLGLLSKKN